MSKILLVADPHAGVKSDVQLFLDLFSDFFENFVVEQVREKEIDSVFILGDLFDNRNNVNVKTLNTVYNTFKTLHEKLPDTIIYFVLGNHDIYYRNKKDVNTLSLFSEFDNIKVISEITHLEMFGRKVTVCPWLTHKEEVEDVFKKRADVCLGHFEINGFEMVPGIQEYTGLSPGRFEQNFKLTFSGHFHLRNEKGKIIYVGNPFQTKWSDVNNDKGAYVVDLKNLRYDFVEYETAPKFKKVFLSQIKKKIVDLKKEVPGNFISLVIDDHISSRVLDKLNFLISGLDPLSFTIMDAEKKYSDVDFEEQAATPIEFLLEFINSQKFEEEINKTVLAKKFNSLYNKVIT